MRWKIPKLDRYLFSSLIKASIVGAGAALSVLLALQIMRLSTIFVRFDLEWEFIFKMLGSLAISFVPLLFPITFLFSLLMVLGRMSMDREFIAMQAMGYSPKRILVPCLITSLIMASATLVLSFTLGPAGNRMFDSLVDEAFKRKVTSALRSGTFSEGFLDLVLFVDEVHPDTQELSRVFVYDESSFDRSVSISASKGRWFQKADEGLGVLKLTDGVIVSQDTGRESLWRIEFSEYRLNEDFSRPVGWAKNSPPSQSWSGLVRNVSELTNTKADARSFIVEFSRRWAMALFCVLLVPLCFALSVDNRRTAKSRAVFIGITVLLTYWTLYFACVSWAVKTNFFWVKNTQWGPFVSVWAPNLLVIVAVIIFWRRRFPSARMSKRLAT